MRFSKTITCTLILLGYTGGALGQDNTIVLWQEPGDPEIPPSAYEIIQEDRTITIIEPGGYTFRFYAHDGSGAPGTGIIDNISVDSDATGDFTLMIKHPDGYAGALDWNEGELRYAGGTSTVTGVKVAGMLADPINHKQVWLDRLDGSIDVGGSVEFLGIYGGWLSASPAYIHVIGDALIHLGSGCAGDIVGEGDLLVVDMYGDLSGTVDAAGAGTIYVNSGDVSGSIDIAGRGGVSVDGDILDSGSNHVRIGTLDNFNCENMRLASDPERWLTFGPEEGPISGNVFIDGTLDGVVRFRGSRYEGWISIGTIDAGPTGDPDMPYGGLYFEHGSSELSVVAIRGAFKQGWIYATNSEAAGGIQILGEMGHESPGTVARILTGTAPTRDEPAPFNWDIGVWGTIWPSEDGEPVIHSGSNLGGAGNLRCSSALEAGATIRVDGDVTPADGGLSTIYVGHLLGEISIGANLSGEVGVGQLRPSGNVSVNGDVTGRVVIVQDVAGQIESFGSLNGGRVHIGGSLRTGASISASDLINNGAIAVDYDGWQAADVWEAGATVTIGDTPYTGNTWDDPQRRIWEIQHCKGDMNNNGNVDPNDPDLLTLAIAAPEQYEAAYPGLEGSLSWHGDLNCDDYRDEVDEGALAFFAQDPPCCLDDAECTEYNACRADLSRNGVVDLADLAELLGVYGKCEGDPAYDPDADFDADGCVGLSDLAHLLGVYGNPCSCFAGLGEGGYGEDGPAPDGEGEGEGDGEDLDSVNLYIEAHDTGGHTGGGFKGEVDHFVFDMKVEVSDPNDDWVTSGAVLTAENDATFRLSLAPTWPDEYSTFVSAPWTTLPAMPNANTVGAYLPPDPTYVFTTGVINLGWFDSANSLNGPATVMRLVIDVSDVPGADVSEGFGSVYFSTVGPLDPADVLVAGLQSETGTAVFGSDLFALSGRECGRPDVFRIATRYAGTTVDGRGGVGWRRPALRVSRGGLGGSSPLRTRRACGGC